MKRIDFRIVIGALFILGGILLLLEKRGLLVGARGLFWGAAFVVAGAAFLYVFLTNRVHWWSAIPAFTLLGLAASSFLPDSLGLDGLAFLGGIGLGFWAAYFTGRERWWAIIPGGVLITLGVTSVLDNLAAGMETDGVFFLGLGLTFLLVAVLPTPGPTRWAYFPAAALIILGILLGKPFSAYTDYIWIAALFVGGLVLIWQYLRSR